MTVPLERALSKLGLATRTQARELIVAGRVRVNGRIARDPLHRVVPERIRVQVDGQALDRAESITIAFHKPRGVVTTRRDPDGRKTIYDVLGDFPHRVMPVGRLDLATSGLLLLTNNTRFADWLTNPVNEVPRIYLVTVRGRVHSEDATLAERGITVAGGDMLRARSVIVRKASNRETHLVIELIEGKNREIRRLMSAIGHEVTQLRRVQIGGLALADLAVGSWRVLSVDELERAFPRAKVSGCFKRDDSVRRSALRSPFSF